MAKIICCKFDRDEIVIYRRKKELVDAHTLKKIEEDRKKLKKTMSSLLTQLLPTTLNFI
ncbi:hypothetical protein JJC04_10185 [Flavobacterium covae]|nr:hypothetical protein [Flavobacterium covae]QYS90468.1 hypothetical protein JJC04_10185 [Flavobacterium covae]